MASTFKAKVLMIDDEESLLYSLGAMLRHSGFEVDLTTSGTSGQRMIENGRYDIIISDLKMNGVGGLDILKTAKTVDPSCEVLILTGYATIETAVKAIKMGAFDYLTKPVEPEKLNRIINIALERRRLIKEIAALKKKIKSDNYMDKIIGTSRHIKEIKELIVKIANTNAPILITGESGTGKELVANAIFELSNTYNKNFITINCASIPPNLLESELFGYVKGAFTGAVTDKIGLIEKAHHGTLFLDEIGDMELELQAKLLRVLQNGEIRRIGSDKTKHVEIRLISATNKDLKELIKEKRFREDLYFRIKVINIHLLPLRERKDDILPIAKYFLMHFSEKYNKRIIGLNKEAEKLLLSYSWPGNVRELINTIERAVILSDFNKDLLGPEDFPEIKNGAVSSESRIEIINLMNRDISLNELEREYIRLMLNKYKKREECARILGISRVTLWNKIKQYGLSKESNV